MRSFPMCASIRLRAADRHKKPGGIGSFAYSLPASNREIYYMVTRFELNNNEYGSGDVVEPGIYIDVETGAVVKINQPDELPEGQRVIHYRRRFRRIDTPVSAKN